MAHIHEQIGLIYRARRKGGTVRPAAAEHHGIRWRAAGAPESLRPPLSDAVKWYCHGALEEVDG